MTADTDVRAAQTNGAPARRAEDRARQSQLAKYIFPCYVALMLVFLLFPIALVVAASVGNTAFVTFPPHGFTLHWYRSALTDPDYQASFKTSAYVAVGAAAISTFVGTAAALALARFKFFGNSVVSSFFIAPLIVPRLVIGIAILLFVSELGLGTDIRSIMLGHAVLTVPFVVRMVGASLAGTDSNLELAARSLGASAFGAFLRITLPAIGKGVAGGAVLATVVSLDDIDIALFLSGPLATTLPVRVFAALEQGLGPDILAVSSVTVFLVAVLAIASERAIGIAKMYNVSTSHHEEDG